MFDLTMNDGFLFHTKKSKPVEIGRPLAPLADTHTHLTSVRGLNVPHIVARAQAAGVHLMVVPVDPSDEGVTALSVLTQLTFWQNRAEIVADELRADKVEFPVFDPEPKYSLPDHLRILAGVHPYGAAALDDDMKNQINILLMDKRCVGIGEIGLDYHCDVDKDIQIDAFREQLSMARRRNLPVELHIRDAADDLACQAHADAVEILKKDGMPDAGCILHCFTQGPDVMRAFVDMDCYIAFGGASTFKNSDDIRRACVECPEHLILSETDAPYMAPHPLRGQQCESAMVALVCENLAQVRQDAGVASKQATYDALWNNACRIFRNA